LEDKVHTSKGECYRGRGRWHDQVWLCCFVTQIFGASSFVQNILARPVWHEWGLCPTGTRLQLCLCCVRFHVVENYFIRCNGRTKSTYTKPRVMGGHQMLRLMSPSIDHLLSAISVCGLQQSSNKSTNLPL
jgi:hypothetical protein